MADLTSPQAELPVGIVGLNAAGVPTNYLQVSADGALGTLPPGGTLFIDEFDSITGFDTVNKWNTPTLTSGGTYTQSLGTLTLSTPTTASAAVQLSTQPTFAPAGSNYYVAAVLAFESPLVPNAHSFFGVGTPAASFTAATPLLNAIGFEIDTSDNLNAVVYSNGTKIFSQAVNGSKSSAKQLFFIKYTGDVIYFFINDSSTPVAVFAYPTVDVWALPLRLHIVNSTTAPSSAITMAVQSIGVIDTNPNAVTQISDGTYGWRKATVSSTGRLQVMEEHTASTLAGSSFSAVVDAAGISATTETKLLYITNPSNSGKIMKINRFRFSSYSSNSGNNSAYTQWRVYIDPTVSVNGTAQAIVGQRQNNQNATVVSAYTVPTASANGNRVRSVRVNSAVIDQVVEENYSLWIEPGHSMLITFQALATGGTLNLDVLWSEE